MRSRLLALPLAAALAVAVAPAAQAQTAKDPFPKTLPKNKTLKGVWSIVGAGVAFKTTSISFGFPLAKAPKIVIVPKNVSGRTAGCPGTLAKPKATSGKACVYTGFANNLAGFGTIGPATGVQMESDPNGIILFGQGSDPNGNFAVHGTWAVTG